MGKSAEDKEKEWEDKSSWEKYDKQLMMMKDDCNCDSCQCETTTLEVPDVEGNPFEEMDFYQNGKVKEAIEEVKAWDKQVGGNHYKDFPIQPTEFIMRNKLSFLQGCIIKRICRYNLKGMAKEDLEKAKHEIDMIMELEGI